MFLLMLRLLVYMLSVRVGFVRLLYVEKKVFVLSMFVVG